MSTDIKRDDIPKTLYMCGVDWQHDVDIGNPVTLYRSAKECVSGKRCTDECGIIEVEVFAVRWVKKQDFDPKPKASDSTCSA